MRRIPPISFSRAVEQQDDSLLPNSIRKLCYKKNPQQTLLKLTKIRATSKIWTQTLQPDSEKPGP